VADLYRIKPLDDKLLAAVIGESRYVVTLEEAFLNGGIGSIVASFMVDHTLNTPLKRLGVAGQYLHRWGPREYMRSLHGLDIDSVAGVVAGIARDIDSSRGSSTGPDRNSLRSGKARA